MHTRFLRLACCALAVLATAVGLLAPLPTAAAQPVMAEADWQRMETEHFEVLYPAGYEPTAGYCAAVAEEAYRRLSPLFRWQPGRITMILSDGNDFHNGYATIFPHPTIQLELFPPDRRQTIYAPDFLRQVIVHELAHILQLDQSDALRGAMRSLFGNVLPGRGDPLSLAVAVLALPANATAPVWFLEGGAQWAETEFGRRGRGETALHAAYLRALVLADRVPAVDEAVLASPDWPYGTAAYLWGLAVLRQWQRQMAAGSGSGDGGDGERTADEASTAGSGTAVAGELAHRFASGFPGWFEPVTDELLGEWANRAWREGTAAIIAEQRRIAEAIRDSGRVSAGQRLTPPGLVTWNPLPSPSGRWVHFVGEPADARTAMYRLDRETGKVRRLPVRLSNTSRIWRLPHAPGWLLFTRLEPAGTDQWRVVLLRCREDGSRVTRIATGRFTESAPDPLVRNRLWTVQPVTTAGAPRARLVALDGLPLIPPDVEAAARAVAGPAAGRPAARYRTDGMRRDETLPGLLHSPTPLGDGRVAVVHESEHGARVLLFGVPLDSDAPAAGADAGRADASQPLVLHTQAAEILHLSWDRVNGRLLFVSGESGVLNVYAIPIHPWHHAGPAGSDTGDADPSPATAAAAPPQPLVQVQVQAQRLTNALVGLLEAAAILDPAALAAPAAGQVPRSDVVAVALDAHGPHLVLLGRADLTPPARPLPDVRPVWPYLDGERPARGPEPQDWQAVGDAEARDHGLLAGLTFQQWHPFVGFGGGDFFAVGATARFADPLGRAALEASAGFDWDIHRWFGRLAFAVQPAEPTFTFDASYATRVYADRFVLPPDGPALDYYEEVARAGFGIQWPLRQLDITWRVGLALDVEWRDPAEALNTVPSTTPSASPPPFVGWRTGVVGTLSFTSLTAYPRSIGPEDGGYATFQARYRPPMLDQADHWISLSLTAGGIVAIPGGSHQLEVRGAIGISSVRRHLQDGFMAGWGTWPFEVRGYPFAARIGRYAAFVGAAYRFPLFEIYRGIATLPFYVRMLAVEVFGEMGTAFDHGWRDLRVADLLPSVGVELQLKLAASGANAGAFDLVFGYAYASERSPVSERHVLYVRFGLPLL